MREAIKVVVMLVGAAALLWRLPAPVGVGSTSNLASVTTGRPPPRDSAQRRMSGGFSWPKT
jgi:hypothetical protein